MKTNGLSIIFPYSEDDIVYKEMSESTFHDLGLDQLSKAVTSDPGEQRYFSSVISNMTSDPRVAEYRCEVFTDILRHPELRKRVSDLFDKIESIRELGTVRMGSDDKLGFWLLMRRLNELDEYIRYVEEMKACLEDEDLTSEGMKNFRDYIDELYNESCFAGMKADIAELKKKVSNIKSVTLGINVNERFEAVSMGLVSVNSKSFKKSGILNNFANSVAAKDGIRDTEEWNGDMHYQEVESTHSHLISEFFENTGAYMAMASTPFVDNRIRATVVSAPQGDGVTKATMYLDTVINKMLDQIVKKLKDTLGRYANIAIVNLSRLVPEFIYYVRLAEFVDKYKQLGFSFCKPSTTADSSVSMNARGFYNMKLALTVNNAEDIVPNDLEFDNDHMIYILTGANRGGKTTVTQALGLLYVLAQGGIYVPANSFEYRPVDCVYTHFPADEDKTVDLGRLGEECVRFKDMYRSCTCDSLLLLNESFSTTSFEEGYYIARDSVKALLKKQVRTIYNTHMHKLAAEVNELNKSAQGAKASSLIVKSDGGNRSFKVEVASPEGMSYARDIAEKYGVTYEMLTQSDE